MQCIPISKHKSDNPTKRNQEVPDTYFGDYENSEDEDNTPLGSNEDELKIGRRWSVIREDTEFKTMFKTAQGALRR